MAERFSFLGLSLARSLLGQRINGYLVSPTPFKLIVPRGGEGEGRVSRDRGRTVERRDKGGRAKDVKNTGEEGQSASVEIMIQPPPPSLLFRTGRVYTRPPNFLVALTLIAYFPDIKLNYAVLYCSFWQEENLGRDHLPPMHPPPPPSLDERRIPLLRIVAALVFTITRLFCLLD